MLCAGDRHAAAIAFGSALKVALTFGGIVTVLLLLFSEKLVLFMGVVPEVVPAAASYMFVRGCAAPANMFATVCSVRPHQLPAPPLPVL